MKRTRHFKLYTGYAEAKAQRQAYLDLAWAGVTAQTCQVRVFRAGAVEAYATPIGPDFPGAGQAHCQTTGTAGT